MEFFEAASKRRSVRKYTAKPVPEEVVERALQAALIASTSSNLQQWEFFWVRSTENKKRLVDACLFQSTARSADHLIVAVARIDTWKRNREILVRQLKESGNFPGPLQDYYYRIIPLLYMQDPLGVLGLIRWLLFTTIGFFRPIMRGPLFRKDLFSVAVKTTALACENFMLAIAAQGYGSCPMEGFDECRVKKLLKLGRGSQVVMIISVGDIDPAGIYSPQFRIPKDLVIKEI